MPVVGPETGIESLYVLAGELVLTTRDGDVHAAEGTWLKVPAGLPRTISAAGAARFLLVHAPGGGAGRFTP
jgi:quercetin dioxygenase-like cupin family protein